MDRRDGDRGPEQGLQRRELLTKGAALAGLGAGALLPGSSLMAEAKKHRRHHKKHHHHQATTLAAPPPPALPSPANLPVDTFVVLMMENRSFDHYFGSFPGADGRNAGLSYPDDQGNLQPTHYLGSGPGGANDFQGCSFGDPDHSWTGGRTQYNNGRLDGFVKASDLYAIGYYLENDIPFIPHLARAFTLYDRYFASILTGTYPNRHYMWSAQCGGEKSNLLPPRGKLGEGWETIFDRALAHGVSVKYYASDLPFAGLYGARGFSWTTDVAEFYADAAAGRLPNIAFVDPPFLDGGGGDGMSGDEHPHGDIRIGEAFMADIVHAFLESPQWSRGAMFVNYDEWGGFFDHVSPIRVPDDRASSNLDENFGITGFRIPGVAVSPYARRGHVEHMPITHESILKLISYKFGLGYLNTRHRYASNVGLSFDWAHPNFEVPDLPSPTPPVTTPCPPSQASSSSSAESREGIELGGPEMQEYIESFGYKVPSPSYDRIFRQPDTIRRALKAILG
jgi:phospholipase C